MEAERKFIGVKKKSQLEFFDTALEESALLAVDFGFAPLDAGWFTCDEGLLKNPDTGADEYMGGVMCWIGGKYDTASRGCHHWIVPAPQPRRMRLGAADDDDDDQDTWSAGQNYSWTQCKQGQTCNAPKDSLVKYVMQKSSSETESLFRLIPVARSFKCEARFFGDSLPIVSAYCLIGVPADLPEAKPQVPMAVDSDEDKQDEQQQEEEKKNGGTSSMSVEPRPLELEDTKGVRIAPMQDARIGDAAYLYLFDKFHTTRMSRRRPMVECAEPPEALGGEQNTVEVV
eukprot:TRINITY_DN7335_c0_g1_i2.p1 TRINITY_DN7335_c0_g1~~TRINITY_DN7335_c0_g1_i2.p1  ORF type:complete len:327 (-),score=71.04 TRINITY_DN7335_c0_g1_i2:321-1178(-)